VRPKYAIFGEKDFQQLFLIKQMVNQMQLPVKIIAAPTIREANGVAMSSRNSRLSVSEKGQAAGIYLALKVAATANELERARHLLIKEMTSIPGFLLDYAEIIDEDTFEVATEVTSKPRAIVAGWINGVRLLDNMAMSKLEVSK
jgi:pantoate--beta-alanine ligase